MEGHPIVNPEGIILAVACQRLELECAWASNTPSMLTLAIIPVNFQKQCSVLPFIACCGNNDLDI